MSTPTHLEPQSQLPAAYIEQAISMAEDSFMFRNTLRKEPRVIETMTEKQLRRLMAACGIKRAQSKNYDDCRAAIRNWLKRSEKTDVTHGDGTGADCHPGHKRLEAPPKRDSPPPSREARKSDTTSNEVVLMSEDDEGNGVVDSLRDLFDSSIASTVALSKAASVLKSIIGGRTPDGTVLETILRSLEVTISENKGLQKGLKTSLRIWKTLEKNSELDFAFGTASSTQKQQSTMTYQSNEIRQRRDSRIIPRSGSNEGERHAERNVIAEKKKEIRNESRSLRLKPLKPNGVISQGILVSAFLKQTGILGDPRMVVEDVRMDRLGSYYLQIAADSLEEVLTRAKQTTDEDSSLQLGDLGKFIYREPVESKVSGKRPIVIRGIDVQWSPEQIVDELVASNGRDWGLDDNSSSDHIAAAQRLSRRKLPTDLHDAPDWIPTKNVKIFVSDMVLEKIGRNSSCLKFDYQLISARLYMEARRTCERCLQEGFHSAGTCRNAPRCRYCGGAHLSSDCQTPRLQPVKEADPTYEEKEGYSTPVTTPRGATGNSRKNMAELTRAPHKSLSRNRHQDWEENQEEATDIEMADLDDDFQGLWKDAMGGCSEVGGHPPARRL